MGSPSTPADDCKKFTRFDQDWHNPSKSMANVWPSARRKRNQKVPEWNLDLPSDKPISDTSNSPLFVSVCCPLACFDFRYPGSCHNAFVFPPSKIVSYLSFELMHTGAGHSANEYPEAEWTVAPRQRHTAGTSSSSAVTDGGSNMFLSPPQDAHGHMGTKWSFIVVFDLKWDKASFIFNNRSRKGTWTCWSQVLRAFLVCLPPKSLLLLLLVMSKF